MQALLLPLLSALLVLGAVTTAGCKKADDAKPADTKADDKADSKAARKTGKTTANIGQTMFSLQAPTDYELTRLGEGDAAMLSWGASGDSAKDPIITISRAMPAPPSLDDAAKFASIGVFVETRAVLDKSETDAQWRVIAKEEKDADGLGGFVVVNVWTRTDPMLWCRVNVKTTDPQSPLVAEALSWCTSLAVK